MKKRKIKKGPKIILILLICLILGIGIISLLTKEKEQKQKPTKEEKLINDMKKISD